MLNENDFLLPEFLNFLDENVELLSKNKMEFQSLTNKYADDLNFLNNWNKKTSKSVRALSISKFEYIINLFPTVISAPIAIFGFLLGISNLEMFSDIFGNLTVLSIALISSIILAVWGGVAIYRQLHKKDLQIRFRNWFYMGILFRLLCKNSDSDKLNPLMSDCMWFQFRDALRKLTLGRVPDIKIFLEKIKMCIQQGGEEVTQVLQLIENLKVKSPPNISRYFSDELIPVEYSNKFIVKIKKIWSFFNVRILSNQDIWDMTINNLGMVAGIVGVGLGAVKTSAKLFEQKTVESTVGGTHSAYINIALILVFLGLNAYCRWQSRKTSARYEEGGEQQSQFILKMVGLRNFLNSKYFYPMQKINEPVK